MYHRANEDFSHLIFKDKHALCAAYNLHFLNFGIGLEGFSFLMPWRHQEKLLPFYFSHFSFDWHIWTMRTRFSSSISQVNSMGMWAMCIRWHGAVSFLLPHRIQCASSWFISMPKPWQTIAQKMRNAKMICVWTIYEPNEWICGIKWYYLCGILSHKPTIKRSMSVHMKSVRNKNARRQLKRNEEENVEMAPYLRPNVLFFSSHIASHRNHKATWQLRLAFRFHAVFIQYSRRLCATVCSKLQFFNVFEMVKQSKKEPPTVQRY